MKKPQCKLNILGFGVMDRQIASLFCKLGFDLIKEN